MIRHKTLMIALFAYWCLMQLTLGGLLVLLMPNHGHWDVWGVFATLSAVAGVWAYDLALKDIKRHGCKKIDRRAKGVIEPDPCALQK